MRKRKWWMGKIEEGQNGLKKWKRMWWEGDGKWHGKLQTPLMMVQRRGVKWVLWVLWVLWVSE